MPLDYVTAQEGESAFDIAARANVGVDDIMKANDFKTPFSIQKGDKVKLR